MNSNIPDIIYKHLREEALSPEEQAVLNQWLEASPANRQLLEQLSTEEEWAAYLSVRTDAGKTGRAYERFMERVRAEEATGAPVRRIRFPGKWGWAAASIILLAVAGAYFLAGERQPAQPPATVAAATVIAPGKEGAILTLADGSQVALDSLGNGVIATQGGAPVLLQNGQVVYGQGQAPAYNTISTPKGRQFRVVLPDGTKAWLNAASSLRYPTLFTGKKREVEVAGEVYFEVTKNTDMPFHVNVNNKAGITVLGTHFNVNAYENERTINTTLLEGSVEVTIAAPAGRPPAILKPGQQAQVAPAGGEAIRVVNNADISKVMAWKNGLFNFEDATLEEAMRQLERWYDIEVVYEKGVPRMQLAGKMTKGVTLNDLMTGLEKMGVRSRLEGRKLIITP